MKTITVNISDSDIDFIRSLHKEAGGFTEEAVAEKIAREKRISMQEILKEGYQATHDEDRAIAIDFQHVDFEGL